MKKRRIRVALCDDHAALRLGVRGILPKGMVCVLEASSLDELIENYSATRPDVVLLDLNLSDHPGATTISYVLEQLPEIKIIVYSMRDTLPVVFASYGAGALGFISKSSNPTIIPDAIETVFDGNKFFEPGRAEEMALFRSHSHQEKSAQDLLTKGEIAVLKLAAKGLTNEEITKTLKVSLKTVRNRLSLITRKTGVEPHNFSNYAVENQLLHDT